MLLFCYVNLRLLNEDNTKIGEFLENVILTEELEDITNEDAIMSIAKDDNTLASTNTGSDEGIGNETDNQ